MVEKEGENNRNGYNGYIIPQQPTKEEAQKSRGNYDTDTNKSNN